MAHLLDVLHDRVLLCDGAMGTQLQARDLDLARDFRSKENCPEILVLSRPDVVRDVHRTYLAAGADIVETDTFGGSPITLAEFDLQDEARAINERAVALAREAAEEASTRDRPRFVLGSVGPGTKLPSLGHIDYGTLEDALAVQCAGLLAGRPDGILIETCQDPLQVKAAVNGAKRAREKAGLDVPLLVQVTVEAVGTMLIGTDIAAAGTILEALGADGMGLNCATGPQEMADHVRWIGQNWPGIRTVQPNAGLPELADGRPRYPLSPEELARWLERFLEEDGFHLIGGCCGTTPRHIEALDGMLRRRATRGLRPAPVPRPSTWTPSLASLYGAVALRQENAVLSIGERCNANGSRRFRRLQEQEDWEACVEIGRQQVQDGSHALDVCTAFVGRDEVSDMSRLVERLRGAVTAPLVIDSTELPVLEAALRLYGGKAVLNSIHFEEGEEGAARRLALARRFGAAVIGLTIDEEGMAKTPDRKLAIARRLFAFACERHGLPPSDLLLDPLTFTIATGNEEDRKLALWTLEAIERIREELPPCGVVLGLSNVSFGLNPPARKVLNSVFLDQAAGRGLTAAIVHGKDILPLHRIPQAEARVAEDLILDRRREGWDPLQEYLALFEGRKTEKAAARKRPDTVEERLTQRIVDGDRQGLEADLDEAMGAHAPLVIINRFLLDGMKTVGELFGAGKMQLPFVLQSAETMKAAVAHLEPHMKRVEGQKRGTVVLATVRGDVHDIGKNLVDIILTNNGFRVVNLGIKQPITNILAAAREHGADAIGMSGLLVKSTVVMRENLDEMAKQGLRIPVLLGGAALTRRFVEDDCARAYATGGRVVYARDAFEGLTWMRRIEEGAFDRALEEDREARRARRDAGAKAAMATSPAAAPAAAAAAGDPAPDAAPGIPTAGGGARRPVEGEELRIGRERLRRDVAVPTPPFWGPRRLEGIDPRTLLPVLNERMLFQFHWGFHKQGRSLAAWWSWAEREVRPILSRILDRVLAEGILEPQAVYGFWPCAGDGDDLVLFEPGEDGKEIARFHLPRQRRAGGLAIPDFFRRIEEDSRDVIGLQVVTIGQRASDVAREWFQADRYQDYLYLHGLAVEMAEALAETVHKRIRADLGFGHEDAREKEKLLQQGYRGSRYSFGYPACPNLADQRELLRLLEAERIGVTMSEEDQLHPEQSTSALVVHHPQARYFTV